MELSEIREKIDAVDDQLLDLFLQRMDLSEEVAAYKNEHHLPILNKERERAILAKVTERSRERRSGTPTTCSPPCSNWARSRQAELIDAPTRVGAQIKAALADMNEVFPQTGLVACQGVEGRQLSGGLRPAAAPGQHRVRQDLPGGGVRRGVGPVQVRRAAH